ncbi:FAD:protein FMN transferase [uncultured Ruminobacter sp.]|jgi:thiamine biosynthesis lipoprotein|uniref:FAD:protein FMN transferase n=1 Tax=Ruminobacter sp. TaxID=2774296 RepID=UPI0025D379BA|nr:FAD:protein FMN transferase [uncultured Ruminobacter sp.]
MKNNNFIKNVLFTAVLSAAVTGCDFASAPKDEIHADGKTMGTFFSITVVGDYPGGQKGLDRDAEEVLHKINKDISAFDKDSVLSKFNRSKSTEPFPITQDMADVIIESLRVGNDLNGATDITVGPLVNLWGFGPKKVNRDGNPPTLEEINAAKANTGLDKIHVTIGKDSAYLKKDNPDIYIDLATVGEGYGADKLAELLDRKGVQNYMVSVAGAIRTKGVNNRGKDWVIAIEDPSNEHAVGRNVIVPVCTKGQAISTAGSYRNFIAGKDGKTFSHIIDPTTGRPVDHKTVSVTVVGPSALWTDAIDTGLMVKGGEAALKYANERNIAIYVVTRNANDDGFETHYSRAMHRYLECE